MASLPAALQARYLILIDGQRWSQTGSQPKSDTTIVPFPDALSRAGGFIVGKGHVKEVKQRADHGGGDKVIRRVRLAYATNGTLAGVNLVSRKFRRRIKKRA